MQVGDQTCKKKNRVRNVRTFRLSFPLCTQPLVVGSYTLTSYNNIVTHFLSSFTSTNAWLFLIPLPPPPPPSTHRIRYVPQCQRLSEPTPTTAAAAAAAAAAAPPPPGSCGWTKITPAAAAAASASEAATAPHPGLLPGGERDLIFRSGG